MLSLTIKIDSTGVTMLTDAGYQIVLLADTQPSPLLVACLLNPISSQTVKWSDAGAVYISMTSFKQGEIISINSQLSASAGKLYTFQSSELKETGNSASPSVIQLVNHNGSTITGGLGSSFAVDQTSSPETVAVTGTSLLNNGQGNFASQNDYLISAISGVQVGSIVLPSDFAPARASVAPLSTLSLTSLPFASQQVSDLTVEFNSATNQFESPQ